MDPIQMQAVVAEMNHTIATHLNRNINLAVELAATKAELEALKASIAANEANRPKEE